MSGRSEFDLENILAEFSDPAPEEKKSPERPEEATRVFSEKLPAPAPKPPREPVRRTAPPPPREAPAAPPKERPAAAPRKPAKRAGKKLRRWRRGAALILLLFFAAAALCTAAARLRLDARPEPEGVQIRLERRLDDYAAEVLGIDRNE